MPTHHVLGGGTLFHVRPHFALAAPAYGGTARRIAELLRAALPGDDCKLHLTRMAGDPAGPETNADVAALLERIAGDPASRIVVLSAALCDWEANVLADGQPTPSGRDQPRLRSGDPPPALALAPAAKLLGRLREARKDLFVVGFKATAGLDAQSQYEAGLALLKRSHANLVLANDVQTRHHVVVAPELARYYEGADRDAALRGLVAMAAARSKLSFTRTTVVPGALVPWTSSAVPSSLRAVVEHCVTRGAYRPFAGVTVGHFAVRTGPNELLSSRRRRNFNLAPDRDLVRVRFGAGTVTAEGARPSAGARSQWAVLAAHPEHDCIVHVHCPRRPGSRVPVRAQHDFECGSHECGENTRAGMTRFGDLAAVMLDRHGPNVTFSRAVEAARVIAFLEENFDLERRSDDP